MKKFKAKIYGEDQFGKSFNKTIVIKGRTPKSAYSSLKEDNSVIKIISFKEIK